MLVDADAGGIDHHDLAFESGGNRSKEPVPYPGFAPTDKPVVAGRRRAVALWYLGPRRPCAEPPENTVQHAPVIDARNAARLVRQQRLYDRPFPVRQFVSPPHHHASIAMERLNHASRQTSSPFMSLRPRAMQSPRVSTVDFQPMPPARCTFDCSRWFSRSGIRICRCPTRVRAGSAAKSVRRERRLRDVPVMSRLAFR